MRLISLLIFSTILISCGKHEQSSFGRQGFSNVIQVEGAEALSQKIMDEDVPGILAYLDEGGSIEAEFETGRTLMTEACFWAKFKVIELLLKREANIHHKDKNGKSAVDYGEENIKIKRLIFPDLTLTLKKTLFLQVKNNALNDLKKTLEEAPPLNFYLLSTDWAEDLGELDGETLLTFALKNKLENVIRLLAQPKYELDVNLKNKKSESPLYIAKKLNLKNTEKILLKLGAIE